MTNKSFSLSKKLQPKLGFPPKSFCEFSNLGNRSMCAEATKKVFWIRGEETEPFIQVDGQDFFTAEEIQETFGLSRTVFFNQLQKKKTHFLDSQEKSHEVTWKSPRLEHFLSKLKETAALDTLMHSRGKKGISKSYEKINAKINQCVENYSLITF